MAPTPGQSIEMNQYQAATEAPKRCVDNYRAIFEDAADAIIVWDETGRILSANSSACACFGYSRKKLTGMHINQLHTKKEAQHITERARVMPDHENALFMTLLQPKNKPPISMEVSISKTVWDGHAAFCNIYRSLAKSRQNYVLDGESDDRLRAITDTTKDAIVMMDEKGNISFWNPAAEHILGYTAYDSIGRNLHVLLAPSRYHKEHTVAFQQFQRTGEGKAINKTVELEACHKDGHEVTIELSLSRLRVLDSWHSIGIIRDITERKKAEETHKQLKAIGKLAAGITHEISGPMQYVKSNTTFLEQAFNDLRILLDDYRKLHSNTDMQLPREAQDHLASIDLDFLLEESSECLKDTRDGIDQVVQILSSMKNFSHPGFAEKTLVDLNRVLENTIMVSRNEWKYTADMVTDFDPDLPMVSCLPGQLNQAILNLIINSVHAIKEKGLYEPDNPGRITISTTHDADWAVIRVKDNGCGVKKEICNNIFDRFFTTKEVGKGTGQGLAIVYDLVVEKHSGKIDFDSQPGEGTTFTIRLPLRMEKAKT